MARWISDNSPLPAFTSHIDQVGKGKLVGGMIISGIFMGEDAGEIAEKILKNKVSPRSLLPHIQKKLVFKFSKTELKKWDLEISPSIANRVDLLD